MPFYEYECSHCRYYAEVMQKITDKVLKKCPSCGKNTFKKLISAPVFRLKGSGWYETDFKSDKDSQRNLAGGDKEDASSKSESKTDATAAVEGKAEAKADSNADAKPDSKADAKSADKSAGKADSGASKPAPKPPAATTRTVAARSGRGGRSSTAKSAPVKRASASKRKSAKRRGGR